MKRRFSRRTFLASLAAGIVGSAIGLRIHLQRGTVPDAVAAEQLAGLIHHADSAALLGRLYLNGAPHEADPARLAGLIGVTPVPALPAGDGGGQEALRKRLAERIRGDFLNGDTVEVDGWLLAISEARLCALVSLLRDIQPAAAGA
jgi:hypothetical protein